MSGPQITAAKESKQEFSAGKLHTTLSQQFKLNKPSPAPASGGNKKKEEEQIKKLAAYRIPKSKSMCKSFTAAISAVTNLKLTELADRFNPPQANKNQSFIEETAKKSGLNKMRPNG